MRGDEATSTWAVSVPVGYRVGRWEVTAGIATGSWGSVYAAVSRRDPHRSEPDDLPGVPEQVALKFLPTGTSTPRQLAHLADVARRELARHDRLQRTRLLRTHEVLVVDDPATPHLDGAVVLVMDRADCALSDQIRRHPGGPVPDGAGHLREVAEGMAAMHQAGWVHGDLKPSNVLVLADGTWCLADFGTAAELEGTHAYVPPAGAPEFMPPERRVSAATPDGQQVRPSGDVWAFGVIACWVLTGSAPFTGGTSWARAQAAAEYASSGGRLLLDPGLPAGWRALIVDCLDPRPGDRPSSDEVLRRIDEADRAGPRHRNGRRSAIAVGAVSCLVAGAVALPAILSSPDRRPGHDAVATGTISAPTATSASATASAPPRVTWNAAQLRVFDTGRCVARTESQRDAVTGHGWDRVWYCGNDPGSPLYAEPDAETMVGWMDTTTSWFVCYRHGARHGRGDDVWYYTQGDRVVSPHAARKAWGFMPADFLHASADPFPGVPRCPSRI